MQAVRANLLRRLRIPVLRHDHPIHGSQALYASLSSTEARSSFLNKGEVTDRVLKVVKQFQKIDPSKVSPSAKFQADLGLDSLDTVEMVMAFEEEFGLEIPDSEADKMDSCSAAIDYIAANPKSK